MVCGDCKAENPKVFVVQDDLWCWHIPGPNLLCLLCAEKRLGRRFTPGDFKRVPANDWVFDAFETDRHSGDAVTRSTIIRCISVHKVFILNDLYLVYRSSLSDIG
jgi:hypothetical protein